MNKACGVLKYIEAMFTEACVADKQSRTVLWDHDKGLST